MKLVVLIFAILCIWPKLAMGEIGSTAQPKFLWDFNSDSNTVMRYELHYGPTKRATNDPIFVRNYTGTNFVPKFTAENILFGINPGVWFISATAISSNGTPSLYSNEICYTNRGTAPMNLRMIFLGANPVLQGTSDLVNWKDLAELTNPPVQLSLQQKQIFRIKQLTNAPPVP